MAITYERPSGAYTSTSTTTNANKYQTDSGASTAISSAKVDGDANYLIDAVNQLGVDIDGIAATGLPSQTGNADKQLTTNGTTASWSLTDTANIAADAITTAKVLDGNITEAKLATSAVTATKLDTNAVTNVKIIDDAVTANKILNDSITTVKILDDNVTLAKMAGGTAGGVVVYDASGNPADLGAGTSGQVVTSAGASATPTWETPEGGGKVLQVVTGSSTNFSDSTSGTWADVTNANLTITPTSATSTIIGFCTATHGGLSGGSGAGGLRILRGASTVVTTNSIASAFPSTTGQQAVYRCGVDFADSPATTSATTYKLQHNRQTGAATIRTGSSGGAITFTILEIGA